MFFCLVCKIKFFNQTVFCLVENYNLAKLQFKRCRNIRKKHERALAKKTE